MIDVGLLGATGIAGQQFIVGLEGHPFFRLTRLAASARSAGKPYGSAIRDEGGAMRWFCADALPEGVRSMRVEDAATMDPEAVDLVFSALEADAARAIEPRFAKHVPVISTASAFRYEEDVPLILPGVNWGHAGVIERMRERRGWRGFIVPNPNCTTVGLAMTLAPLHRAFGVERVVMTSLQAVSGAGRTPGVSGLDIIDNVIPHIPGEEEKVARETRKILGEVKGHHIEDASIRVAATCLRVPVLEGHTEAVSVVLSRRPPLDEIRAVWIRFAGERRFSPGLPSAPAVWIAVHEDPYRPQPRLDRDAGGGMTTSVGRLRENRALVNGIDYLLVTHNTRMGAALGAVLTAEGLVRMGYIEGKGD